MIYQDSCSFSTCLNHSVKPDPSGLFIISFSLFFLCVLCVSVVQIPLKVKQVVAADGVAGGLGAVAFGQGGERRAQLGLGQGQFVAADAQRH